MQTFFNFSQKKVSKGLLLLLSILMINSLAMAKEGTVVCLHGFMRTKRNMRRMVNAFEKEGWHTLNWSYPSREYTIEEHAKHLVADLVDLARTHPGEPIHFVTHSMGGVIVRAAVNLDDCPIEAKRGCAVLIAPPNKGTTLGRYLARFGIIRKILGGNSGHELMTANDVDFDCFGQFPPTMEIMVIAGDLSINPIFDEPSDGKVSVEETRLKTPHEHRVLRAGHSWISMTPKAIKLAREFITNKTQWRLNEQKSNPG